MYIDRDGLIKYGQVRSECLKCTFRASCCSTHLSQEKKGGGSKEGLPALSGTREYEQSDRNWQQAEVGLRCYGIWTVP